MLTIKALWLVNAKYLATFSVYYLLAVLDQANDASFRFDAVVASATGAWLLIACVCDAEAAIHSTGSD